jgi:DNA-binding transcriptional LysR family regulator
MHSCMAFEWDDARIFLAIHRAGSLSGAGRELRINQSTVGRRLGTLEEAIGARLFDHTPDGYVITSSGERFLARAERMESEADDVAREIAGVESRLTGIVRVTAADAFGLRVLTPILGRFHERYPEIEVSLISNSRVLSLSKRESDIGLRSPRPKEPALVTRRVAEIGYGLYATRGYIEARGRPRPGTDFEGHDLVGYDEDYGPDAAWLALHSRRGRTVMRLNRTLGFLELALMGVGLALLPCYLGDPEPNLVRVFAPTDTLTMDLWLVLHKDMRHTARVRACADFIAEALLAMAHAFRGAATKAPTRARKA